MSAQKIINDYNKLKARRETWDNHYQIVAEYVLPRKSYFETQHEKGARLNDDIFDSTAVKANGTFASSIIGAIFPSAATSFKLDPPAFLEKTSRVTKYYQEITEELSQAMDSTKSGLGLALDEYMQDQGAFGTSGIAVFENEGDYINPLRYTAWDVVRMVIDEGKEGFVDTVYYEQQYSIKRTVQEYGMENVSEKTLEAFNNGDFEKSIKILKVIRPRILTDKQRDKEGNKFMPFESYHIEMEANNILKESGFEEMPIIVARFRKAIGEIYGRSPAMNALPAILEANQVMESITVAIEKNLDMPFALFDDGSLGNATIDTSPGAVNILNPSGLIGSSNPIVPLYTVGEIKSSMELLQDLRNEISDFFFIDKLLDFNNQTQMTLGEAQIRNAMKNQTIAPIYERQYSELINRLIERSFNIMFRAGRMGVTEGSDNHKELLDQGLTPIIMPEEVKVAMAGGKEAYKITYLTPATIMTQAEKINNLLQFSQAIMQYSAVAPEIVDKLDSDKFVDEIGNMLNIVNDVIRSEEEVGAIREGRLEQQQQANQLEQLGQAGKAAKDLSQAEGIL